MTNELTCSRADWNRDQRELMAIRHLVFVNEQGVPQDLELDEYDQSAAHFIVRRGSVPVATGRLKSDGQIGRMAVLPEHRGQGIGDLLLKTILDYADTLGKDKLYLHSQVSAIGFYERHGFTAEGEEFEDAGIPHRAMVRKCAT